MFQSIDRFIHNKTSFLLTVHEPFSCPCYNKAGPMVWVSYSPMKRQDWNFGVKVMGTSVLGIWHDLISSCPLHMQSRGRTWRDNVLVDNSTQVQVSQSFLSHPPVNPKGHTHKKRTSYHFYLSHLCQLHQPWVNKYITSGMAWGLIRKWGIHKAHRVW